MQIRPKENYKLLGTGIELNKERIYYAMHATNLPDWKEKGKIFVQDDRNFGFLLEAGEYEILTEG